MDNLANPDPLLADIEAFLERTGMSGASFGLAALNDSGFMTTLKRGRDVRRSTRLRVLNFIQTYQPDPSGSEAIQSGGLSNAAR